MGNAVGILGCYAKLDVLIWPSPPKKIRYFLGFIVCGCILRVLHLHPYFLEVESLIPAAILAYEQAELPLDRIY